MTLHFEIVGGPAAPVVLFLNSLGTTLAMWDEQVATLAQRYRVIRCDQLGHGRSPVPDGPYSIEQLGREALAVLDAAGASTASVVGLSLGAMVAMWLATHAPERIDSLVLACTSAHLGPPAEWLARAATVRAEGMSAITDAVLSRWFTPEFASSSIGADAVGVVRRSLLASPAEGYAGCCEAVASMNQLDEIAAITAPTLVIAGDADPATPLEHALAVHRRIDGSRLVVLPAAHLANIETANAFTRAIDAHLSANALVRGMAVRRHVMSQAHVDRASADTLSWAEDFQEFLTRYAWGDVWSRPGLDRRTRSAITLALLTAGGHEPELGVHLKGALSNGLTREEIAEVLMHTALYAGLPAANRAFAIAQATLGEAEAR